MTTGSEVVSYRESRALVAPAVGWAILTWTLLFGAGALWNAARGHLDIVLSLPGLLAFLAIAVAFILARQIVEVTASEIVVGHSLSLSRRIPLIQLQAIRILDRPPSHLRLTWPLSGLRVFSLDGNAGVEFSLTTWELVFIGSGQPALLAGAIVAAAPHLATGDRGVRGSG